MAWQPPGAYNPVALWQSDLNQGSEHYLIAFYNKLSAAVGLFFWH